MRIALFLSLILCLSALTFGQNELAPIVEKEFEYKNWTYNNLNSEGTTELREFAKGKKLVMVVYWAPWCMNWRYDYKFVQELHEKYGKDGLAIIGVGEYDPVESMKNSYAFNKLTFPSVYETTSRSQRQSSDHFKQRGLTGDRRGWGTPWYVFLTPDIIEAKGDVIAKKANVVSGELMREETEKFIRTKLGLDAKAEKAEKTVAVANAEIDVCDPAKVSKALVKPKP